MTTKTLLGDYVVTHPFGDLDPSAETDSGSTFLTSIHSTDLDRIRYVQIHKRLNHRACILSCPKASREQHRNVLGNVTLEGV